MAVRQPVTLTQVAEAAGVSIATVSRVLNRRGQVDEHTRRRVMTSVENLGYDASSIARKREARIEQRMFNVELLLCPLAEQKNMLLLDFMAEALRGVQSFFSRHGNVRMNICTWEPDEIMHHEENEMIFNRLVNADGVLVIGNPASEIIDRLVEAGVMPVLISTDRQDIPLNSVCFDDFAGGVMAARHLVECGFRRIGFLCGSDKARSFLRRRSGVMVQTIDRFARIRELREPHPENLRRQRGRGLFPRMARIGALSGGDHHFARERGGGGLPGAEVVRTLLPRGLQHHHIRRYDRQCFRTRNHAPAHLSARARNQIGPAHLPDDEFERQG